MRTRKILDAPSPEIFDLLSAALECRPTAFSLHSKRALRVTCKTLCSIVDGCAITSVLMGRDEMTVTRLKKFKKLGWIPRMHHLVIRDATEREINSLIKTITFPELRFLDLGLGDPKPIKLLATLALPHLTTFHLDLSLGQANESLLTLLAHTNWPLEELKVDIHRMVALSLSGSGSRIAADGEAIAILSSFPKLRNVSLRGLLLNLEDYKKLATSSLPHLESFELEESTFKVVEGSLEVLASASWPNLLHLDLQMSFTTARKTDLEAFAGASWLRRLETLKLMPCQMNRSMLRTMLKGLCGGALKQLELGGLSFVSLLEFQHADLPMLQSLSIIQVTTDDQGGEDFLNIHQEEESEGISLNVFDEERGAKKEDLMHLGIAALFQSTICRTLEVLRITCNEYTEGNFLGEWTGVGHNEDIHQILVSRGWEMPRLRTFIMAGFAFQTLALIRIGKCLAQSPLLTRVCLGVKMPKNGLSAFVASLPQPLGTPAWPLLETLDFPIGDYIDVIDALDAVDYRPDLEVFLNAAGHFPRLQRLVIENAGIMQGDEGRALARAAAAGTFPQLKYLSISGVSSAAQALLGASTWPLEILNIFNPEQDNFDLPEFNLHITHELGEQLQHTFPVASVSYGLQSNLTKVGGGIAHHPLDPDERMCKRDGRQEHLWFQDYILLFPDEQLYPF